MPCVDHDYGVRGSNVARERADQLASEICKLRQLVYDINKGTPRRDLRSTINRRIGAVIDDHKKHREKDREAARKAVAAERRKIEQNVATIKRLGGIPGKELCMKVVEFQKHEKVIADSNPMDTGLY